MNSDPELGMPSDNGRHPEPSRLSRWSTNVTVSQVSSHPRLRLPDGNALIEKAAGAGPIIYQPYLTDDQRSLIHAQAIPLDISFNTRADTREYELFRMLHMYHQSVGLPDGAFWGLVSSKFETKSTSPFSTFLTEAANARTKGADAYIYNPLIGCASVYANVWEHALTGGHPGMEPIFEHLRQRGYPVAVLQGAATFFFCNYMCGNRRFWSGYFAFCESILDDLEEQSRRGAAVGSAYHGPAHYWRDSKAVMRPFVIERLLGLFVQRAVSLGLKVETYTPTFADFEWKFGQRVGTLLHRLNECKEEFLRKNDAAALQAWQAERKSLVTEPHLVWHLDDPPSWMART